jgi:hypothetical protein
VCFVDFHKAFDTVIHPGIRYKLIRNGINGLFYRIICNMYSSSITLVVYIKVSSDHSTRFIKDYYLSFVNVNFHAPVVAIFVQDI